MTSSVIKSENEMSRKDFDTLYQEEIIQLQKLKSLIVSRFPHFREEISKIEGFHNRFWGTQRILLRIDYENDKDTYRNVLNEISKIVGEIHKEISNLNYDLGKYIEGINKSLL